MTLASNKGARWCPRCNLTKGVEQFHKRGVKGLRQGYCKPCQGDYNADQTNGPERMLKASAQRRLDRWLVLMRGRQYLGDCVRRADRLIAADLTMRIKYRWYRKIMAAQEQADWTVNVARSESHRGERNGNSKLTEAKVRFIRSSDLHPHELADLLGISPSNVSMIRGRKSWCHVA